MKEQQSNEVVASGTGRKRYQRPEIVSREPLEALAAVCEQPGAKDVINVAGCINQASLQS